MNNNYPYVYAYNCVAPDDEEELEFIIDNMVECPRKEFLYNVGFYNMKKSLPWNLYSTIKSFMDDWAIGTYKLKSNYYNPNTDENSYIDVYVLVNSAIEFIYKRK